MKKIIFSRPLKDCLRYPRLRLRRSGLFLIFCMILFSGIVFGAVSGGEADKEMMNRLDIILLTNFDQRCSQGMISAFVSSFASSMIFLTAVFLLGLSLWGEIAGIVPFFKGYGYGLSVGYLYGAYGLKGIAYNILVILPGIFISSLAITAASLIAVKNSVSMVSLFRRCPVKDDPHEQMKRYMISMLWCLFACAVSAAADMLFSLCFSWIFDF